MGFIISVQVFFFVFSGLTGKDLGLVTHIVRFGRLDGLIVCFGEDFPDDGNEHFLDDLLIELVFAFKLDGMLVVFAEHVIGASVGVVDAKESVAVFDVKVGYPFKLFPFHHHLVLDDVFGDAKLFLVVFSAVEKLEGAGSEYFTHG